MNVRVGAVPLRRTSLVLRGGEVAVFDLAEGDLCRVVDAEGRQRGLLFARDMSVLHGVPPRDDKPSDDEVAAARDALGHHDADMGDLCGLSLFPADAEPGATVVFRAQSRSTVAVIAPGARMAPDQQTPPTDLRIEIETAGPSSGIAPPPLAMLKLDQRILAGTASAFRVSAGDYIQIIDVDGKQCSDFLAFDAAALAEGREFGLDPTVTRTLMGTANPGPGLHSKYFDARMTPLVEIVRDTVGRHDAFLLACSAKYYEDMGYPGHDNCTDNFNRALKPFGVAPRAGWPAINFFYNTFVQADDTIAMDEPWSRPGDYVLLRALTDLVCATSSCADDIDTANAWNPTDIHVRLYDKAETFSKGIAHRMTPDAEPRLTRETGFHPRTAALTRSFVDYRGFWLPDCFSDEGPIAEYWACRERAAVMDLSALRKFEVIGPDAEDLMQLAVTRDIKKLAVGQVVYTAMCYAHGGMIDDGTVFRLGQHNFRWVCGEDYCGIHLRELAAERGFKAWVKTSTDQLHNIAVQGPRSRAILATLLVTPAHHPTLIELKWFRFTVGKISGIPVIVSRTGYTGELGYEVWCHPAQAPALWDAVMAAGAGDGIAPLGLKALDMLRIEAGLAFGGYDFSDQTDPFEAGIGFVVPKDKADPYIGAGALARRRANPMHKLVGLDVVGNEPVGSGDCVHLGRAQIGVVTSATRSPILGKTIALARLDVACAAVCTAVEIGKLDGHQKRLAAQVGAFPHFDPQKTRVRADASHDERGRSPPDSISESLEPRGAGIRA
ncbi:aminomethyltransferase family protein [Hyphomicrobiales bacterium BP6-180914]|uniref:Aminomethyltransferase family protein n=1 Tax=Lichenifustis flavocetrariae TaxID=2949735 RepID=A0AA42CLJ6_9HYPH|nr:aminomethyltransferase family protein [Lichenifustis flavocetrariae]MCW6511658.1 aminomethyltransferase family protein [Lichenifustis flavocetrariae]